MVEEDYEGPMDAGRRISPTDAERTLRGYN